MKMRAMVLQAWALVFPMGSAVAQVVSGPGSPVPLAQGEAGDIRGIRGPVEIPLPPDWRPWVLGGFGALVLVAAIWLFVRARMRRAADRVLTARERALAALEEAHGLMVPESSREYAYAVSDALRGFIEARFRLPSTRQTTEEFLRAIAGRGAALGPYRPALGEFLGLCDAGKFGGWQLGQGTLEAMHVCAVALIHAEVEGGRGDLGQEDGGREMGDRKIDDRKIGREEMGREEMGAWNIKQVRERTTGT